MMTTKIWYALKKGNKYLMYEGSFDYGPLDDASLFETLDDLLAFEAEAEEERKNGIRSDPKKSRGEKIVKVRVTMEEIT